jgi:hypothetical protein
MITRLSIRTVIQVFRWILVISVPVWIVVSLLAGCEGKTITGISPTETNTLSEAGGSASYPSSYDNFAELFAASDMVALGTVDRVIEVIPQQGSLFFTRFVFKTERIYKGGEPGEIILSITGAPDKPGSDLPEDPLFHPGERWVLFLHEFDEGLYYDLGPWGRYQIIDGKVYSMNRLADISWYMQPELDYAGVAEDEFYADLTETLNGVHLTVLDSNKHPDRALRFMASITQTLYPTLWTGKDGPAEVTYNVVRVECEDSDREISLPDGMEVSVSPDRFQAEPRQEYRSTMTIHTTRELQWGTYWLVVRYRYGDIATGQWQLMVNIHPAGGEVTIDAAGVREIAE